MLAEFPAPDHTRRALEPWAAATGHVIVSLGGVDASIDRSGAQLVWGADDVIAAWE